MGTREWSSCSGLPGYRALENPEHRAEIGKFWNPPIQNFWNQIADEVADAPAATRQGEKIKAELDDLLDEIDEVLETNAEDFVKSFIQKGGE